MACKNGIRANLEQAKAYYQRERELENSCPFRSYWRDLVSRVFDSQGGFESLNDNEKLYYSVNCLNSEIHNGGFAQYFDNSVGERAAYAEIGLATLGANDALRLFREARYIAFGDAEVPVDRLVRMKAVEREGVFTALDKLDDEYYKDLDNLGNKLEQFALDKGLVCNANIRLK